MRLYRFDRKFVRQRSDYLLTQAMGRVVAPVDLASVARVQRIRTISIRPMVPEGLINPIAGGFEVFVQGSPSRSFDLAQLVSLHELTVRHRFTLAHEIAHTLFFDVTVDPPIEFRRAPQDRILEDLCQYGAAQILLPERLLARKLRNVERLTGKLVCELASDFQVSAEVVMQRLDEIPSLKELDSALLLAAWDESRGDAQIRAVISGTTLVPYLPKPELYASLKGWCGALLDHAFWHQEDCERECSVGPGKVWLRKIPYSARHATFFLELEFADEALLRLRELPASF